VSRVRNIALWSSNNSPHASFVPSVVINLHYDCASFTVRDADGNAATANMPLGDFVKFAATFIQEAKSCQ